MGQEHILTVPGHYKEIKRICEFVAAGASRAGFDEDEIFHLELCCDEASTNIIEHSYGEEGKGVIVVSYQTRGNEFIITLRDNGNPFDPSLIPPPPAFHSNSIPAEELTSQIRIGGLGLHFIRKLMDKVSFRSDRLHGNELVMIKKLYAR
jgi:serine/threonine-protein kinase RsbW